MKELKQQRRLRIKSDLEERAWWVLENSKELVREKRAHAARLEQLITRRENIARETQLGDHRRQS